MEPLLQKETKSAIAVLIPYKRTSDGHEYFLQKRDANAPTNPSVFSMFGGSLEGQESPEEGMLREIEEELRYRPSAYQYLCDVETVTRICHVFIEEVGSDFESRVQVCEGEYGAFKTCDEIEFSKDSSHIVRTVLYGVARFIEGRN